MNFGNYLCLWSFKFLIYHTDTLIMMAIFTHLDCSQQWTTECHKPWKLANTWYLLLQNLQSRLLFQASCGWTAIVAVSLNWDNWANQELRYLGSCTSCHLWPLLGNFACYTLVPELIHLFLQFNLHKFLHHGTRGLDIVHGRVTSKLHVLKHPHYLQITEV